MTLIRHMFLILRVDGARRAWVGVLAYVLATAFPAWAWGEEAVTIFAAASTQPVLERLAPAFATEGLELRTVHAGSSTLARQIAAGAPADIYISANAAWMDELQTRDLIVADTRENIATNRLVLVTARPLKTPRMAFGPGYPLADVLGDGRFAIAAPDHVPAGMYARQALQNLELWDAVKGRLAPAKDVTGALLFVQRGEARLGAVYASDVRRVPDLTVFARIPARSHDPVVYPAAVVAGRDGPAVRRAFALLTGPVGQAAFRTAGFGGTP